MEVFCKPQEKIIKDHRNKIIERGIWKSLAVANALELLKLVFLNTSLGSNVQASLAATLQLYSESEIFTVVSFLKEKNSWLVYLNLCFLWNICFSV
jgi:general transcription factor 3C polypeptide 1